MLFFLVKGKAQYFTQTLYVYALVLCLNPRTGEQLEGWGCLQEYKAIQMASEMGFFLFKPCSGYTGQMTPSAFPK